MDPSLHKPNLYRWKKQGDSRLYSRSQRVTTNNDVKDWIKKVEQASDLAAEEVFGERKETRARNHGLDTCNRVREADQALTEAQELLSQWMEEKVGLDSELDVSDEAWYRQGLELEVKREWDHLLEDNLEPRQRNKHKTKTIDPYENIYEMDDREAVSMVLHNMMEKDLIKDSVVKKLGQGDYSDEPDPRMKMEMRHKQVKENREKRQTEIDQKRRKAQSKKEAHFHAKQIVLQEEKEKAKKMKHEEMEIQKEMAKIRKEMQEEKRKTDESRERRHIEMERSEKLAKDVIEDQKVEIERERDYQRRGDSKRRHFLIKMEALQTRQAAVNLKILQRNFSAWYNLILERHMKLGKAKALGDWRCLLKAWNSWKSYTRSKKLEVETQRYQSHVKETHRKSQRADHHYKMTVLQKCFRGWHFWVQDESDRRELEEAQSQTRSKMMAFLNAAATGQLWQKEDGECTERNTHTANGLGDISSRRPDSAMRKIDDMFETSTRKKSAPWSETSSVRSSVSAKEPQMKPANPRVPREAWQVTRKHCNLSPEEIASLGGDNNIDDDNCDEKPRKGMGKVPWNIPQMPVTSFENRHRAQQKILDQQQKQLKEQQRIIEELQFTQQNHTLQQQLSQQQQELQKKLDIITTAHQVEKTMLQNNGKSSSSAKLNKSPQINNTNENIEKPPPQSARSTSTVQSTTSGQSEAPSSIVSKTSSKHVNVLKKMEDRAAERARTKEEREMKRQKAEEEKMRRLEEDEAEILCRQEEEKRARVMAYKEKKRLEKQKEVDKLETIERFRQLNVLADAHYQKSLLKYRGLLPMRRLVEISLDNEKRATNHAATCLLRKTFSSWHVHVTDLVKSKTDIADEMNKYLAVRHCFNNWKNYKNIMRVQEKKASRHYQKSLLYKVFMAWADITAEEKVAGWERERHARQHDLVRMKKKMFQIWRQYPQYRKAEEEREKRMINMRRKVATMLPDFKQSAEL